MDFYIMMEYLPLFIKALKLTLKIGWIGVLLSIIIGLICSFILYFRIPILKRIVTIYTEIYRNTPLLVQLFFIYFALPKVGISLSAEFCGMLGLGLIGGSYMSEVFRSGLESIDKIQSDSGKSLGMNRYQLFTNIILPQAFTRSIPGLVGNIIFLLKETSVFSTISLMDLMFTAKDLIGMYAKTIECLTLLVIFYMIMLIPVSIIGNLLERKLSYGEFGN